MSERNTDETKQQKEQNVQNNHSDICPFPVVGIGASAGGLEALQEFFKNLPENPGAAFVIVQHLSPDYKSLMDELLARYTDMKIHRVEDGMEVRENNVFLIPPRKNMTVFHGKLLLTEQNHGKSLNLPIDIFFRSLAQDQEKNAVGIILSGTGSDGTLGIRAIKEFGGMTMVQDDRSAKFDGMPRSSISTGLVDFILPATELGSELVNYIKHPLISKPAEIEDQISKDTNQFTKIISILRDNKRVDFSEYKDSTIVRRLEKRISINRFERISEYTNFLINNKREVDILFKELLIGVTRFFRDEEAFDNLQKQILPVLFDNLKVSEPLRIWAPGCSTGEEAYSLAILIQEYMREKNINREVKIFATDIDTKSLEYAGVGLYTDSVASDVSAQRLSRYFTRKEGGYRVNDSIRGMVIFARHNILRDPPFSKIDLITCRNLLIYLENKAQQRILSMFYISLRDPGFLFLGSSESLGNLSEGFRVLDNKNKLYRYKKGYTPPMGRNFSVEPRRSIDRDYEYNAGRKKHKISRLSELFTDLLNEFLPPSVIVDDNNEIVHTVNNVNRYIKFPAGEINLNLLSLLPKDLAVMVSTLLRKAHKQEKRVIFNNIETSALKDARVNVSVKKLSDSKAGTDYFIVSFEEVSQKTGTESSLGKPAQEVDVNERYLEQIGDLEKELQYKSESLQATVEELETSNEELQSSNEELIASNEELQSTNEELQSVNEELSTVNAEHQEKIEELTELNSDIHNLLVNTGIGTLFLDRRLAIRKVNDVASKLTNIRNSDIGRPIEHLSFDHLYKDFVKDIDQTMENLRLNEREIQTKNGEWFLLRILPYRTDENAVMGIIVIFINITQRKKAESEISELNKRLQLAMNKGGLSWWEWDYENNYVIAGEHKSRMLGYKSEEMEGGYEKWADLIHPDDYERAMQAMRKHIRGETEQYKVDYRIRNAKGNYLWFRDYGGIVDSNNNGKPKRIAGIVSNITSEKQVSFEKKEAEKFVRNLVINSPLAAIMTDGEGIVRYMNEEAEKVFETNNEKKAGMPYSALCEKITDEDGNELSEKQMPAHYLINSKKPYAKFEHIFIVNGTKKEFVIHATPFFHFENEIKYISYTCYQKNQTNG
jgi:two-component system CheB/CheR fusion protein